MTPGRLIKWLKNATKNAALSPPLFLGFVGGGDCGYKRDKNAALEGGEQGEAGKQEKKKERERGRENREKKEEELLAAISGTRLTFEPHFKKFFSVNLASFKKISVSVQTRELEEEFC